VGNPLERAPEAVLRDVKNGLVSVAEAAKSYGVGIDPKKLAIDDSATRTRRKRARSR
jgi:N-methylhydantoinase B/oxoprolinase/acetone carboxylase alpha subunit